MNELSKKNTFKKAIRNIFFVHKVIFIKNRSVYYIRLFSICTSIVAEYLQIFLLSLVLNELVGKINISNLIFYISSIAVTNIFFSFLNRFLSLLNDKQRLKISHYVKLKLSDISANMLYSKLEEPRIKDFIHLAANSDSFENIVDKTFDFTISIIKIILYGSIIVGMQPVVVFFIISVIILELFINSLKIKNENIWRVRQAPVTRKLNYYSKLLSHPEYGKEMRVNNLQQYFLNIKSLYTDTVYMNIIKKSVRKDNSLYIIVEIAKLLKKASIYLMLGIKVFFHSMKIGDFSLGLSSANKLTDNLSNGINNFSELISYGVFAGEFKYCLELVEKNKKNKNYKFNIEQKIRTIEFKNVSFKYPNTNKYVLKDISFKINNGEKTAIIGINGAGKTTIIKLLSKFYEPTKGSILINGKNIKNFDAESMLNILGVVFQDYKLFPFSIAENIAFNEHFDIEKINESIKYCNFENKVKDLEQGIDTIVYKEFDEFGVEFSGGESQKMAISRLLYSDKPILIFDEPTSSLDPIAEYDIINCLNNITQEKTVVYTTHRMSLTHLADKIIVISEGKIEEIGSHEQLIKNNGVYSQLYLSQAKYYT